MFLGLRNIADVLGILAPLLAMQAKADADTLTLDDSLMFRFDKLTSEQANNVKLYLVDDEGNIICKAMKTENGFVFNYLPQEINTILKWKICPKNLVLNMLKFHSWKIIPKKQC